MWQLSLLAIGLVVLSQPISCLSETRDEYIKKRDQFIAEEKHFMVGGDITLTDSEKKVSEYLLKLKLSEITRANNNDSIYPPAIHFFHARSAIEKSRVFKILSDMPKGGALHLHDCCSADIHWLIKRATYDPDCYLCTDPENKLTFHFFPKPPANKTDCNWQQVVSLRKTFANATEFDERLYHAMTMIVDAPEVAYKDQDVAWQHFLDVVRTTFSLIFYAPVFRDFCTEMLTELYRDNVQYAEIRSVMPQVYELDGTLHDADWCLDTYKTCVEDFKKSHPDFVGARFIYTSVRTNNRSVISAGIKTALRLQERFPSVFAGYDLASQEDKGHTLFFYLDELLHASDGNNPLKFFFHAGETDWEGIGVDENLIDAILLNVTRIGHGYAITKHPKAMAVVQKKSIALEVNPISNQVLMLLSDLRNHPMASLLMNNYPLVISADDPAMWGIKGLSYDFYEAFMGLGGAWADLRTLKVLIMNSLRYSATSASEKQMAFNIWHKKWIEFIQRTVTRYHL